MARPQDVPLVVELLRRSSEPSGRKVKPRPAGACAEQSVLEHCGLRTAFSPRLDTSGALLQSPAPHVAVAGRNEACSSDASATPRRNTLSGDATARSRGCDSFDPRNRSPRHGPSHRCHRSACPFVAGTCERVPAGRARREVLDVDPRGEPVRRVDSGHQRDAAQLHHVTVEGPAEWIAWWDAQEASA